MAGADTMDGSAPSRHAQYPDRTAWCSADQAQQRALASASARCLSAASPHWHPDTYARPVGATATLALLKHRLRWCWMGRDADPRDSNPAAVGGQM